MMGDKIQAKKIAKEHGLPVIEGSDEGVANIEKAKRLLGYSPSTIPEEGLAEQIRWYRDKLQ